MPGDGSTAFATALSRFHRRLRLVAFVRHASITSAIGLGIIDVVLLMAPLEGIAAVAVGAAIIALALGAAYALAVFGLPSPSVTARIIDRELGLHDRATTALQFCTASDAVSRLVVDDAARHLEAIPSSRLRIDVPAFARWAGTVAVIASVVILVSLARSTPAVPSLSNASARIDASRTANEVNRSTRRSTDPASVSETERPANDQRSGERQGEAKSPVRGEPAGQVEGRLPDHANTPPTKAADATPNRPASPLTSSPSAFSGAGTGSQSSAQASGDAARSSGPGVPAAGRGASGALVGSGIPGGVGGGGLAGGESRAAESSATAVRHTAIYAAAYGRAESATRRETVPANLRSYVRAYFLAIRPGQ